MGTKAKIREYFRIDKELIIIFLLVAITGITFFFVSSQRAFLNFFYIPVLIGAYFFGKRYATHSAVLSIIMISVIVYVYPESFAFSSDEELYKWLDIVTWGGFLFITGYFMGLLFEKKEKAKKEIKNTYRGIIEMLSLVIDSVDKQTQSHSYRVSVIAEMIAREMGLPESEVENIRIAALLHDLGKIGVSAEILHKIGKLSEEERESMKSHPTLGAGVLAPVGGRVLLLLPLILHHHEKYDGKGYHGFIGEGIPIGARIIAVADVYDALTTDRPYRTGLSPLQARKEIVSNAGTHFDPEVVSVFDSIFHKLDSELPFLPTKLEL
ncbi:MAG: HD domain-containing protein [Nitrospirae bacterium]|nr:HD domain-containing protein [Nitrospirota bacterium]